MGFKGFVRGQSGKPDMRERSRRLQKPLSSLNYIAAAACMHAGLCDQFHLYHRTTILEPGRPAIAVTITMIIGMMLMMMMAMTVMMMKKKMMMSAVMVPRIEVLKTRSRTVISVSTILELLVAVKMLPLPVL